MGKQKETKEFNLFTDYEEVEGNIFAEIAIKAAKSEITQKNRKIEDFGEKIGGARKDLYAAYCDLMKTATEKEIEKVPLSKSFPAPNYKKLLENGIERWKLDAVRVLRDTIPMKPKKYSWKIAEWAEETAILRDMSINILENQWTAEDFSEELEEKLEEKGIRNDYLVNYSNEESWEKATENSYKMEKTYPYPTVAEMEDIKAAYEYLFDCIRFKAQEKEYELYSARAENIQEMLKESKLLFDRELTAKQTAMNKMSEEVFGIELKYFEGSPEVHGKYDENLDIMYLNEKEETSLDWTFWHEAFHVMKKHESELYEDILKHVESHEFFTNQQIEEYREAVKRPKMSKSKIMEEMLADAFADMKTGRRIVEKISKENRSLAVKLADFTKKLLNGMKKFFKAKEVQEKYPEVALTNMQFRDFTSRIEENINSLESDKNKLAKESKGYKILRLGKNINSPYKYRSEQQKKFDVEAAKRLVKKYSVETVGKIIQELSPLGEKNKKYGNDIAKSVKSYGR